MAKFNLSFHFTFTPRDDSCLMEACVLRLLYCSLLYQGATVVRIVVCTVLCFLLYHNFFLSGTKYKVLIGTCLLELRLEILGFGQRVLDVKLLFLVTYTPN